MKIETRIKQSEVRVRSGIKLVMVLVAVSAGSFFLKASLLAKISGAL